MTKFFPSKKKKKKKNILPKKFIRIAINDSSLENYNVRTQLNSINTACDTRNGIVIQILRNYGNYKF